MNREHYLSKRLRSQHRMSFDRPDQQESGVDAGAFPSITGVGENKRLNAGVAAKAEAADEPDMKSEVR